MDIIKTFNKIKKSHNPELINDFLIKGAENPSEISFEMVDYFIENLEKSIFDDIKINLAYLIGEIALLQKIPEKYLNFLTKIYYQSDRWVRNEIVKSISKIISNQEVNKKIIDLLNVSIKEEYLPIKKNTLDAIIKIKNPEFNIIKNLLIGLDTRDSEVLNNCKKILQNQIKNEKQLFEILDNQETFKDINKQAFRTILTLFFQSVINVEKFRERIENSEWNIKHKEEFLKEIDTYQRILLRNL
ncbi:MAG: hypothetical protein ACQERB_15905 [Promethearchaeati archaeon]